MNAAVALAKVEFSWPGGVFRLSLDSLTIARGERVFLSGESGSGKSTLLALIAGILTPKTGVVSVDGTDLAALKGPARDRFRAERIGVIFQMFNLLSYAPPLDNILLPLAFAPERRRRVERPEAEARRLAAELGLDADVVGARRSSDLSIGQQQRIAAARALIGGPSLVIADEPTSALDATAQAAFLDLLMAQAEAAGATLLMVSHDDRMAARFDRQIALADIARVERSAAA
ncbi:MAG: ATP-binding cassette domain-containing protein [Pseudomonadota bacterium]